MKSILFVLSCCILINGYSQDILWASKVVACDDPSWNKKNISFGPEAAIGAPDNYPSGKNLNGYSYILGYQKGEPKIKVQFEFTNPNHIAKQIVIVETSAPGAISEVVIEDFKGKKKKLFSEKPVAIPSKNRIWFLPTDINTAIKYIYLKCEPSKVGGHNAIDAIGIINHTNNIDIKINLGADLNLIEPAKALNKEVNSEYNEVLPVISPDGKRIYFDRKNHPYNVRNPKEMDNIHDDIWSSPLETNGQWGTPYHHSKPLNNWSHNFINSISPDNTTILLANTYTSEGEPLGPGASITHRKKEKGWTMPEALNIKNLKNKNIYVSYFLSNNKKVLLMSIEDDKTLGEKDICVSFALDAQGKNWSEPMNLGNTINTPFDEYSPVLASDGVTMYFASNGHIGYGSYDIYVSKRLDDTWKNWSTPINLGPNINNETANLGFTIPASGDVIYTYQCASGNCDIYATKIGQSKSIKPNPVYLITGTVYDAKTKKPIHADISYEILPNGENAGHASSDPDDGSYNIVLPLGAQYGYHAEADGYYAIHENLEVPSSAEFKEIKQDLYLVPIIVGETIRMNNVFFVQSKPELLPGSYPELNRVYELLTNNPKIEIRIDGHTDNHGDAKANYNLSRERVEVVKNYLASKGVDPKRITTKAFGGSKPIADNRKEETRKLNRRVEFMITKK